MTSYYYLIKEGLGYIILSDKYDLLSDIDKSNCISFESLEELNKYTKLNIEYCK